jgi:signal peptidase II
MARTGGAVLLDEPGSGPASSAAGSLRIAVALVAVVVAAADQISKSIVLETHAGLAADPRGWISIQLARNHGASTGIGASHPLVVTAVELLGVGFVAALAFRVRNRIVGLCLGLVLGGALGNLADRFVRAPGLGRGAVVDWIHLGGRGGSLDLADIAIQLGAVLAVVVVLASSWADARRRRRQLVPN